MSLKNTENPLERQVVLSDAAVNGVQWHILSFLGVPNPEEYDLLWGEAAWCKGGIRYSGEYLREYINRVNKAGGIVSVDVKLNRDGSFDPEQIKEFKKINS